MDEYHPSALLRETVEFFHRLPKGARILDATLGHGGHAKALLDAGFTITGLDLDAQALAKTEKRLPKLETILGKHSDLPALLGGRKFDGVLADLGIRLDQLERDGMSFHSTEPPDMRLDPTTTETAIDLLLRLDKEGIKRLFCEGGVRAASLLSSRVDKNRDRLERMDCQDLARLLSEPGTHKRHPATRAFMALRRAVNDEEGELCALLAALPLLLNRGGIAVLIAWHQNEDLPVKRSFKRWERMGIGTILTPKPLRPTPSEIKENPRSRSARLRAIEWSPATAYPIQHKEIHT